MRESMKRAIVAGAVVIVMMSFAAPAMAEDSSYSNDNAVGVVPIDRLAGFMGEWFG
jgi:hypothetical protein